MNRILVIRGGAIGDFILTLPAIKALRQAHPAAQIEILGYRHIAVLGQNRFHADRVRSIESGELSRFFAKGVELPPELADYFADFDLIISYLYDPDSIFKNNLARAGANRIIQGPAKINCHSHATRQLTQPIQELELQISDFTPKVFPSPEDQDRAAKFLAGLETPFVALHPGSGSDKKNWPLESWVQLGDRFLENFRGSLVIVAGEADASQTKRLQSVWQSPRVRFAHDWPLPELGALLNSTIFLGHDSGISHLAAAAGASCILLFGPTDPAVWAPLNDKVRVIRAPEGDLARLDLDSVGETLDQELIRIGIRT